MPTRASSRPTATWAPPAPSPRRRSSRCPRPRRRRPGGASTTSARRSTTSCPAAAIAAMIAIENSVEGGVSATQDALATHPGPAHRRRVPGRPSTSCSSPGPAPRSPTCGSSNAHPVAYAQTHLWLEANLPGHGHMPGDVERRRGGRTCSSGGRRSRRRRGRAARRSPSTTTSTVLAERHRRQPPTRSPASCWSAATVAGARPRPAPTRRASSSSCPTTAPAPCVDMLEQFATRGINMSLLPVAADRRRPRPLPVRHRPRRATCSTSGSPTPCSGCKPVQPERDRSSGRTRGPTAARSTVVAALRRRGVRRGARLAARAGLGEPEPSLRDRRSLGQRPARAGVVASGTRTVSAARVDDRAQGDDLADRVAVDLELLRGVEAHDELLALACSGACAPRGWLAARMLAADRLRRSTPFSHTT